MLVGLATYFDAFNALAIAQELPVLAPLWKLSSTQIGFMKSVGYLGQLIGALCFGLLVERIGRVRAPVWAIALFELMSLASASHGATSPCSPSGPSRDWDSEAKCRSQRSTSTKSSKQRVAGVLCRDKVEGISS